MTTVRVIGGLLLACLLGSWLLRRQLATLSQKRLQGGSLRSWDHPKADDVINYIRREIGMPDFPVMPTDSLEKVYGISDEDLDDAVVSLSPGVSMETRQSAVKGLPPVQTVQDLANALVQIARRHETAG